MKKLLFIILFNVFFIFSFAKILKNNNILDSLDIIHYGINLRMDSLENKKVVGNTVVTYKSKVDGLTYIVLDLYDFEIDSVFVSDIKTENYIYNDNKLKIYLDPKNANDIGVVNIYYQGIANDDGWGGFYITSDNNYAFNMGVGMYSNPHSVGRYWYPCIDDFKEKAQYSYSVRVRDDYMALCSGNLKDSLNHQDGTITYEWEMTYPIPTYLSSVAIGKYYLVNDSYEGINKVIPINIYCEVKDTSNVIYAFRHLKSCLEVFESKYGPYVWDRVGYVIVPFDYGAMEHVTNIALPQIFADGTADGETTIMHELSHHWFGNLVTCATNNDMWLNEGFAVFSEGVFTEEVYGEEEMRRLLREYHKYCLHVATRFEKGAYALDDMPMDNTYSGTIYRKGATVAQTLRYHIGSDDFFKYLRSYFTEYAFKNVSINEFREFLEKKSGMDLSDFFENWIHNAGYPHFSIDYFDVKANGNNYDVTITYHQKGKDRDFVSSGNKIEVLFMDANWNKYLDTLEIGDVGGSHTYTMDFEPIIVMIDPYERVYDATTDEIKIIKEVGTVEYENVFVLLETNSIKDSSLVRITHNWVKPDYMKSPISNLHLSNNRYWKVEGLYPNGFKGKLHLYYSRMIYDNVLGLLDTALIKNSADSLVVLYRKDANSDWSIIKHTKSGNNSYGFLITDTVMSGEYVLGIWDSKRTNIENILTDDILKIYPNPAKDTFKIEVSKIKRGTIKIYNLNGVIEKEIDFSNNQIINVNDMKSGVYFVRLYDSAMQQIVYKKIIIN